MDLDEAIKNCLTEFTNPVNEIRQEAEKNLEELSKSNKYDAFLTSLINIIDNNPQSTIGFSALIQLRYYIFLFLGLEIVDNEYLVFFRNAIQQFLIDLKFPQNLRLYMVDMMGILFIFSLNPRNLSYPDIFEFMDKAIQIPEIYSNIIEFYIQYIFPTISKDIFDFYDEERINFIFSHLDPECDQKDRSCSAIYFIRFWDKYSSTLSSSIDFISILNELDDKYFRNMANYLIPAILAEQIEFDPNNFYDLFYNRIVSENLDETFRQYCLYSFIMIACQVKSFYQIILSDMNKFMEMMFIVSCDPHKYPILYDESKDALNNLKLSLRDSMPLVHALVAMTENNNPYVSSIFQRFVLLTRQYKNGISYSTQEDPFIRENGIYFLRKLLKYKTKELYSMQDNAIEEIATCLFESYLKYKDSFTLKALSTWCNEVRSETLSLYSDSIVELCTNILSFETIECGSSLLRLNEHKEGQEDDEFAIFLLSNVDKILSPDYQPPPNTCMSLRKLVDCLPNITRYVSPEKKVEFMNFFVPCICSDVEALFSNNLGKLLVQLGENINLYGKPILSTLFKSYSDAISMSDSSTITNFLYAISSYGKFFSIFEENYLQLFIEICLNIIKEDTTFTQFSIPYAIRSIGKMVSHFKNNEELFNLVFDIPFNYIYNDDDIDDIRYYLKLILILTDSKFFNEEKASLTLENIKKLFDHCSKAILKIKESDDIISSTISTTFNHISEYLFNIQESLFEKCQNEICQIVSNDFIDITSFPLEIQTSIANVYFLVLENIETEKLDELGDKLMQNLFSTLSTMPTNGDDYQLMLNQLSDNDIVSFFSLQDIVITGFGNLLYQKNDKIDIEMVDQLIEFISNVASIKDDNDYNGELNEFQDRCVACLSKLITAFKLKEDQIDEKVVQLISLIYSWLPRFISIGKLTFDCYFRVLLFCISTNISEDTDKIQEMMSLLCKCIAENKVPDTVLRNIYNDYHMSKWSEIIDPILVEIQNFLK